MISYERARRWRNILLHAATVSLAVAWGEGFRIIRVFVSGRHAVALALVILASFLAAVGIRLMAGHLFDTEDEPWYARFTAFSYIVGMMTAIMAVAARVAETSSPSGLSQAMPVEQMVPLGVAFTIAWIVLFDWPFARWQSGQPRPRRRLPPKSAFASPHQIKPQEPWMYRFSRRS